MFTKRIRTGTVGVGTARPIYSTVIDWDAVWGAVVIVIGIIVLVNVFGG